MSGLFARMATAVQTLLGVDLAAVPALTRRWRRPQPRQRRALDKRALERALRAEGVSAAQAKRVVARVSAVLEPCDAGGEHAQ